MSTLSTFGNLQVGKAISKYTEKQEYTANIMFLLMIEWTPKSN